MAEKKPSGWAAYNARVKAEKEAAAKRRGTSKKRNGGGKSAADTIEREVKKGAKRLPTGAKVAAVFCLLVGILAGAALTLVLSRNDRFELVGGSGFSVELGSPYTYTEEGVEAVCFGRDVSDRLHVETDLEKDAEGRYIIPTDKEGVYTIVYTVDCIKFGENAPNGVIRRIRTFTVTGREEDGRDVGEV